MSDLIDTTQMYLRTIYEVEEEGIAPMRARIAERLGHSGPTVSQTVARMERDGLVVVGDDRHLRLTAQGRVEAMRVMRKHRLAECLLTDVIGLDWPFVHDEACRWEHVMSERVEQRLVTLLGHPRFSPYGNPIPGLAELGDDAPGEEFLSGVVRIDEIEPTGRHTVARLAEPLQLDPQILARLQRAGIAPGVEIEVAVAGSGLALTGPDGGVELPLDVARHIFVAA